MKELTVSDLKSLMDNKADFQLVDVREPHEYEICNLGGDLIPLSMIPESIDKIKRDKQVIVHCRSGARSGQAVSWLEKSHGFTNIYNLKGGLLAWSNEVDPNFPKY
ncbi:MAG: rhodanese-like domain-containing protein [Cyclobacteriaceae bacterium]